MEYCFENIGPFKISYILILHQRLKLYYTIKSRIM